MLFVTILSRAVICLLFSGLPYMTIGFELPFPDPLMGSFDWAAGNTSIWLSAGAYCERSTYSTRNYKGASAGFIPTYTIYDKAYDTNGYIGYRSADQTIYVVFRGSSSIPNWIADLDAILTAYPNCAGCEVHKGFYKASKNVFTGVQKEVTRLRQQFSNYKVAVTGHSLGAALATLTIADLALSIPNVRLINFGSPRVGNDEFAAWFSLFIGSRMRITHHKDIVPHCPMHERFTHISGEWYHEDMSGDDIRSCSGYEDPTCSYQWSVTSVDDHMHYIGLDVGCQAVS